MSAALARAIVDANAYMTLATADGEGRPWASPVWFAHAAYRDFLWVSRPGARHSTNLVARSEVAIVIFDSTVSPGDGKAVYIEAHAEELDDAELDQAVEIYSGRSEGTRLRTWTRSDVTAPAEHRLYRARASAHFVLSANDQRIPVKP